MTTFLICYSNTPADRTLPRNGETIEIETLADIDALANRVGPLTRIIIHPPSYSAPWWTESIAEGDWNAEDCLFWHAVTTLPLDWRELRWIEVYNGYRE